jgi:chromosome segregation ATPase
MSTATTTLTTDTQAARAALDGLRTTGQAAEAQVRTLTEECAALQRRRESLSLDARLGLAGSADELAHVEARLGAAVAELEDARRLAAEAARREPAAIEALHTAAFDAAVTMLAELEAALAADVAQIRREQGHTPPEICERVVRIARQVDGLAHDLFEVSRDARFARRGTLRERLGPEAAALIPQLVASPFTPKPAIPRPWSALLDDLEEAVRP